MSAVTPDYDASTDYRDPRTYDLAPSDDLFEPASFPRPDELCWCCNQFRVRTDIGLCRACRQQLRDTGTA